MSEGMTVSAANTAVLSCRCAAAGIIVVKSAAAKFDMCPTTEVPWMNRTNGVEFQDKLYGPGMRLHNVRFKGKELGATCTVCGARKSS